MTTLWGFTSQVRLFGDGDSHCQKIRKLLRWWEIRKTHMLLLGKRRRILVLYMFQGLWSMVVGVIPVAISRKSISFRQQFRSK